jgi:hypothetical protein
MLSDLWTSGLRGYWSKTKGPARALQLAIHLFLPRHVRRARGKLRLRDSSETRKALI